MGLSVSFPGAKRPLEEGAKLGLWEFVPLHEGRVTIPPADIYILAAWHPAYEQLMGLQGRIGVLWTSSAGEMDFVPVELGYLTGILADPRISFIWFGHLALAELHPAKGFYAPYPLDTAIDAPVLEKADIATLFCPPGPKKNILNQLIAMALVQREIRLTLHTNVPLNQYRGVVPKLDAVEHGWLPQAEYHRLLGMATVNLACSWCETFNYNVAEAALMGTPSVTSSTIPVAGLPVADPNDPREIEREILAICNNPSVNVTMRASVRQQAERRNSELRHILATRLAVL